MTLQKRAGASVQENDYQIRLDSYKAFVPVCYFFQYVQHCARYEVYYAEVLKNMKERFPENREILLTSVISV